MAWIFGTGSSTPSSSDPTTVETSPYDSNIIKEERKETTGDRTFPAGAYRVVILPILDVGQTITVNGETISEGGRFEVNYRPNNSTKRDDFVPQVSVSNAAGKTWWYHIEYPSDHPISI